MSSFPKCSNCGGLIIGHIWPNRSCYDCHELETEDGEVTNHERIRCPKCGHQEDVFESEKYHLAKEDGGETSCGECGHDYFVNCYITYTFTSPERIQDVPAASGKGEPCDARR